MPETGIGHDALGVSDRSDGYEADAKGLDLGLKEGVGENGRAVAAFSQCECESDDWVDVTRAAERRQKNVKQVIG
jgi:hypothetical protein